ncbi:hypothetical protein HNQ94_000964 [Salirhabdus euzebyi]|uniref:Uncharacterized protein n=1 Tax=Salirhabdus euzebyi TaxID=394506 RepID=A0A841PUI5_9BACI|nr:hypothetical protein [Salirhabdus euzebyi]MBB6452519.1 hypothetical protein [Salirhabdus euzebyi]
MLLILLFVVLAIGLVSQIKEIKIIRDNRPFYQHYKRLIFGNYLCTISYTGLLFSFGLNILVYYQFLHESGMANLFINFGFFIFFAILITSKIWVIPKEITI